MYERTRREFVDTVTALTAEQLRLLVPATPAWSVRDVLAHVVGLATDLNSQRFPEAGDAGGAAWTRLQVESRHAMSVGEVIAEWDREAATFEDGLRAFGYKTGSHFVADLHAHHQDVRAAVGSPPDTDELTVAVALDHYLGFVDEVLTNTDWGTLEVVAGAEIRQLGEHRHHLARVRAQPFDVLRALSARRSVRQILALDWEGDADGLLAVLQNAFTGNYSFPAADLIE